MKRILSFVLCLSMLLAMLPVSAFAADTEETTATVETAMAEESTAATEPLAEETTLATEETVPETTAPTAPSETTAPTALPETTAATEPPETAQADPAEETASEETETFVVGDVLTWVPDLELPSDEELFAAYADRQFYGGIATFGTAAGETLNEGPKLIYDALAAEIAKVASGQRTSAVIAVGEILGDVPYNGVTIPCTPAKPVNIRTVDLDLQNLLDVLLADFPYDLYWFDKVAGVSALPITSSSGAKCIVFYFTVSSEYRQNASSGEAYNAADYEVKPDLTAAAVTAAANAQQIVKEYEAYSDYEKLLAYKDKICQLTSYNGSAASSSYSGGYGNPWQMIWVFDGDSATNVVCEGYSKAFQYLCDQSEFENEILCYSVVGYLNPSNQASPDDGAHMWNVVTVNGSSYLVDVTNCDGGYSLFLRGGTTNTYGGYTFAGQKFFYDSQATALWGTGADSILTLDTEDLTEATFPTIPEETEPSEPTEPTQPEETDIMTGEELVAAIKASTNVNYALTQPVVITSDIELPNNANDVPGIVNVCGGGSITIKEGGSLTFANTLDIADGGMLTVEIGGSLTVSGCLSVGIGGKAVIEGTYTIVDKAPVVLNYPGTITGIEHSDIHFVGIVRDEDALIEALSVQDYASHEVNIPGYNTDGSSPAPVVLTRDISIPEGCTLLIGDESCGGAVLQVADGVTLTNNGTLATWMGATLILGDNAVLTGPGTIANDGTITSYGTITGTVSGDKGTLNEYMSQSLFQAFLSGEETELTVSKPLTLTQNVTIPAGKYIAFESPASLTIADGASLTVMGSLDFFNTDLTVQPGGSLALKGQSYMGFYGSNALTIHSGASYAIQDEAEIYVTMGTTLTGITKGEVCNSNMLMDPADDLEAFAEIYGAGYKRFYLSIATDYTVSEDMTLPDNIVLDHYGNTVTITNGATLTVNGSWDVGAEVIVYSTELVGGDIVVEDGALVNKGSMTLNCASALTVEEKGSLVNSGSIDLRTQSTLTVKAGAAMEGDLPVCRDESAVYINENLDDCIYLYIQEDAPDFFENGCYGLYPGSSLHVYGNRTAEEADVDSTLKWSLPEISEEIATVRLSRGVLTVTAAETLTKAAVIPFTISDSSGLLSFSYEIRLRPRANTVDVAMDGKVVTGETVFYDLNRQDPDAVMLTSLTTPEDANNAEGYKSNGKTRLVRWSSSDTRIATVEEGIVAFTGKKTGKVKITMTANFGSTRDVTAAVTFHVAALEQEIHPDPDNAETLIGGSSAAYAVTNKDGETLKSSAVRWFLCDKDGAPIESHPYASVTAAGKLSTKAVAYATEAYLMAQVVGDEHSAFLSAPVKVSLYPAISTVQILDEDENVINGTEQRANISGDAAYQLSWTVGPCQEAVKSVGWKSSATAVATIDENGKITVKKPGTAKLTLTVIALNGKKTTASVTMKFGIFAKSLELSALLPGSEEKTTELDGLSIFSGESIRFYGEVLPDDVTTDGIKWSVDNKSYATISSSGKLKAKTVYNPVTVTVIAQSKDGSVTENIPVKIQPKQTAVLIQKENDAYITKTTQTLEIGKQLKLKASEAVTWSSSKASVATVDKEGNVTALAKGTATITARTADNRKATVTVAVTNPFLRVTITTKKDVDFVVASGKSLELKGTVEYEGGSKSTKVTWSVSDTSLATISSSGKLTAVKGLTSPAVVQVAATAKEGGWSNSQDVQILPLTTGVAISGPDGADISNTTRKWDMTTQGTKVALGARTFPEGAGGVTWKSSSTKTATVDQEGNVVCLKSGTVTITATAKDGSGKKASFKLTIHRTMEKDSLKLPDTAFIGGGKSLTITKLTGYAIDAEATNKTLNWTLTYPNGTAVPKTVATLSNKGVLKTKAVTAPVALQVTAAAADGSGETAVCAVTVYPVTKGITLYNEGNSVNRKTVSLPINSSLTILPDTTNAKSCGTNDDKTADEYLPNGTAWNVTRSKQIARVEFDGQAMILSADGAAVGQSVKITLKAADGSGKSAYFTVKFTEAASE